MPALKEVIPCLGPSKAQSSGFNAFVEWLNGQSITPSSFSRSTMPLAKQEIWVTKVMFETLKKYLLKHIYKETTVHAGARYLFARTGLTQNTKMQCLVSKAQLLVYSLQSFYLIFMTMYFDHVSLSSKSTPPLRIQLYVLSHSSPFPYSFQK